MSPRRQLSNQFRIRVADCGTEQCRGGYSTLKDPNALTLARRALAQIMHGTVEEKAQPLFQYHLACLLLSELQFEDKKKWHNKLKNDVENVEELRKDWNIT